MFMRIYPAAVALLILSAPAGAQTNEQIKRALGETASELQQCAVYFLVTSVCISSQDAGLASSYRSAADRLSGLALSSFQSAGTSRAAFLAQGQIYSKAMMTALDNNCSNIAVLQLKYMEFCKGMNRGADPRLLEWIACAKANKAACGGPELP